MTTTTDEMAAADQAAPGEFTGRAVGDQAQAAARTELRFGTFLAPALLPVYRAVAEAVGRALNMDAVLVAASDYDMYAADAYDVCFICGLPYVDLRRRGHAPAVPVAAPVLNGTRYAGRPIYYSDVIVRRSSAIQTFLDLRGHSWAYNEQLSQSGYGITRYSLLQLGETRGFFSKVIKASYHAESIRLVAAGEVDGSAIDSQVLALAMRDEPALATQLRTICALGPSTIQPVAVSKRLSPELRAQVTDVLLSLHNDPIIGAHLSLGLIDRFVRVGPESYDDIRGMLDACHAAGFTAIK